MLTAYRGNLGLDAGIPSSVYQIDQGQVRNGSLKAVGEGKLLRPGEKWTLDDGTTVEFLGTEPYDDGLGAARPGAEDRAGRARWRCSSACCSRCPAGAAGCSSASAPRIVSDGT